MGSIIASIAFFAGIAIAVFSAFMVAKKNKSRWWYALPSIYSLLVNVTYETTTKHGIDIWAMIVFAAALTLIKVGQLLDLNLIDVDQRIKSQTIIA
jgi:hypothetical protein